MTDSQIILLAGVIIPLMGSLLIEWVVDKLERVMTKCRREKCVERNISEIEAGKGV